MDENSSPSSPSSRCRFQQRANLVHEAGDGGALERVELGGIPDVRARPPAAEATGHQSSFWKVAQSP